MNELYPQSLSLSPRLVCVRVVWEVVEISNLLIAWFVPLALAPNLKQSDPSACESLHESFY